MYDYDGYDTYRGYIRQSKALISKFAYGYIGIQFAKNIEIIEEIASQLMNADWRFDQNKYPNVKKSTFRVHCGRMRLYRLIQQCEKWKQKKQLPRDLVSHNEIIDPKLDLQTILETNTLTDNERSAILTYYIDELSYRDAASKLGTTINNLKGCITSGLDKIRSKYMEYADAT